MPTERPVGEIPALCHIALNRHNNLTWHNDLRTLPNYIEKN